MTRELFELIADIRDFTTLFYVILRRETSGRFIKTENVKCDVCFIIVTPRKAFRPLLHEVDEWLGSSIESDLGPGVGVLRYISDGDVRMRRN